MLLSNIIFLSSSLSLDIPAIPSLTKNLMQKLIAFSSHIASVDVILLLLLLLLTILLIQIILNDVGVCVRVCAYVDLQL